MNFSFAFLRLFLDFLRLEVLNRYNSLGVENTIKLLRLHFLVSELIAIRRGRNKRTNKILLRVGAESICRRNEFQLTTS